MYQIINKKSESNYGKTDNIAFKGLSSFLESIAYHNDGF